MIRSDTKVWTPEGWQEARLLKEQSAIYSWNGRHWLINYVEKVRQGQSRTTIGVICMDGVAPTVLKCTPDQQVSVKKKRYLAARDLASGCTVACSEGAHVFRAELAVVEREHLELPEAMLSFDLAKKPNNFLAAGFLCRP